MSAQSRRVFIQALTAVGVTAAAGNLLLWAKGKRPATPPNPQGPFFVPGAPTRQDLKERGDSGLPLRVRGHLLDINDRPLTEARLDVFHADPNGAYDMKGFRYRVRIPIQPDGSYEFETLVPGHYNAPDVNPNDVRPEHVHYVIQAGRSKFTTQLYFSTDPFFESDPARTLSKDPLVKHLELIRPVELFTGKGKMYAATNFDLFLEVN